MILNEWTLGTDNKINDKLHKQKSDACETIGLHLILTINHLVTTKETWVILSRDTHWLIKHCEVQAMQVFYGLQMESCSKTGSSAMLLDPPQMFSS